MNTARLRSAILALLLAQSVAASAADAGRAVYKAVCIACHAPENVMVDAPKSGDVAEWRKRLAKGLDATVANAVAGIGAMPAKGGAHALSTEQIRQAIRYMASVAPDEVAPAPK